MAWQPENVTIKAPLESNGAIPINIQDQHSRALDLFFIQQQGTPQTLTAPTVEDAYTVSLTDATGFVDGNKVGMFDAAGNFFFGNQIGAPAANVITLDTPLDFAYPVSGTVVIRALFNMNVNGAAGRQIFQLGPIGTNIEVDITRVMGYIQDASAMDDALFGGISALTKGVIMRKNNGIYENYWNVKSNGDLGLLTFDANYTDKAPAGSYGLRFRNTYGGQDKHGVTIRLEASDILEILIQDDLTGLEAFRMMAQGHIVTD